MLVQALLATAVGYILGFGLSRGLALVLPAAVPIEFLPRTAVALFLATIVMGALGAVPGGLGAVVGGEIPYKQEALAQRQANRENRLLYDPAVRCYMPGIPRATYQPFPFQIVQTPEYILFAYEFASASRIVYMNRPDFEAPADAWMGHSRGRWDGESLVIDVTAQVPQTWFDRSGNYHGEGMRVEERYTWKLYAERMMTQSRVYGFWKYVTNLERQETRRYIDMFYGLQYRARVAAMNERATSRTR